MHFKVTYFFVVLILISHLGFSQKITYTEGEKEDSKQMNFEVIGKFANNIIVYKNVRTDNYFSVYDNDMKLKEKFKLSSLPYKLINVDFVTYPTYFYMIYQHQKKNVVYCEAIKFDVNGKKLDETITLDTTTIPVFQNDNKIYELLVSDNKEKIGLVKANRKNERNHLFVNLLFNNKLELLHKKRHSINMDGKNNFLDEFVIDNDGDIYIAKCYSVNGNEYISKMDMLLIPFDKDTLYKYTVDAKEKILDEIILRVDNISKKIIIQSFFYAKRRGNVEGLYVNFFDKKNPTISTPNFTIFNDSLRKEAKDIGGSKTAFNDFFIRQVFPRKDGGFIMAAEGYYSVGRGNGATPWNRFDYLSSTSYLTDYDYYNMSGRNGYWNSYDRYSNGQYTTYTAENVAVFSFAKNGSLEWSNVVHKNQKSDNNEDNLSYQILLTGGKLHFLFNESDRNDFLMYDNSITPTGQLTRHPTLKNLNRQYTIMTRHGKQISAKEMIFPCTFKNYICFAKIEF